MVEHKDVNSAHQAGQRFNPEDAEDIPPSSHDAPQSVPLPPLADTLDGTLRLMAARQSGKEKPIPLPWPTLGRMLSGGGNGLWPGLHVLVSGSGVGKTQFSLQTTLHAARAGTPVAYCGLEMGRDEVTMRLLGIMSGVHWSKLFHGRAVNPDHGLRFRDDMAKAHLCAEELRKLPIHVDEGEPYGWPYTRLQHVAKALTHQHPNKSPLIIVDFLQLVSAGITVDSQGNTVTERLDLRERIARAAYQARAVARMHNAAVLLISSTARENYGKVNGNGNEASAPEFGDEKCNPAQFIGMGKESGEIEFSADSVMVIGKAKRDADSGDGPWPVHVALAKVRAGRTGWVHLSWDGNSFSEGAIEPRTVTM